MRLLLDTHVWLWSLVQPEKIGAEARALMEDPSTQLVLSAASTWEISIKYRLGRLALPEPPESFIPQRLVRDGIEALPVEHHHACAVASLPQHHQDPFDRLLVAVALSDRMTLVTADRQLLPYDVTILMA